MANATIIAALKANPVPADRQCIRDADDVLAVVQDFMEVDALASATPSNAFPTNNNTANQAKATADAALQIAQSVEANQKQRRSSGVISALPAGDSVQSLTWTPELPDTNYMVHINLYGAAAHPSSYFYYRVIAGTPTTVSVDISIENAPAGSSFKWMVEQV